MDYINGPYWSQYTQDEIDSALSQLEDPDHQLCANLETYLISGGTRSTTGQGLRFMVDTKIGVSDEIIRRTIVYTAMINRYFAPKLYNQLGYMEFI